MRNLDVIRGVAVLGILLVNIRLFAMPSQAYLNPTAWGDFTGVHRLAWLVVHLFAEMKFLSLFSMLFGAGVCMFTDRLEARGAAAVSRHYGRMGWLLLFGLAHAYLLWPGDILVSYAICGSVVVLARRKRPRTLLVLGAALLALPALLNLSTGLTLRTEEIPNDVVRELEQEWSPDDATIAAEIAAWRGGWAEQQPERVESAAEMHLVVFPFFSFWFCTGAMLVGMALYRLELFQGTGDDRRYRRLALGGVGAGLALGAAGVWWNFAGGWNWDSSMFLGATFNQLGAPLMAVGYLGVITLAVRRGVLPALETRLSAVGRMAFTNYILQTLLCSWIFFGTGLGQYAQLERAAQLWVVAGVWLVLLVGSPIWLRRFQYGPLEWAWRALTYRRFPAMVRVSSSNQNVPSSPAPRREK